MPGGYVFVDGKGIGDVGPIVMRDREVLASDGFVSVLVLVDEATGGLYEEPEFISRGFVFLRESEDLLDRAQDVVAETVASFQGTNLTRKVEDALSKFFYNETKRRPMVFTFVREIPR